MVLQINIELIYHTAYTLEPILRYRIDLKLVQGQLIHFRYQSFQLPVFYPERTVEVTQAWGQLQKVQLKISSVVV